LAILWIVVTLPGGLQRFLAARRLRADRRAGVILLERSEEEAEWEILPCSRFLWTEKGQPARWRSEREGDASTRSVKDSIWYRDLSPRFESRDAIQNLSRPIQDAIGSPRALGAVVPIGFLALSIWSLLSMPPIPTTSQILAPFVWAAAAILSFGYLLAELQSPSEDLRPADTGESSRPHAEGPKPPSGELRRALQPSERDRVARLASQHSEGFWLALAFPVVGGLMAMRSELSDRGWYLALALVVAWKPFWMSGLRNAWAALQLRRDLREGSVVVGRSDSESGEIEWLARSRFAWTEDGEPVAWREE
jgi:hypothetical protein